MSGSLESVRCACVHRPDLFLYSYPKEFGGNGVRTHVNSKGKKSLYRKLRGGSNPRRSIRQDSEPNTLPTELFRPCNSPVLTHTLPRWPSGKASASRAANQGSIPAFALDLCPGPGIPVLHWLPCQAPGVMAPALGLVGPVSVHCDRVR